MNTAENSLERVVDKIAQVGAKVDHVSGCINDIKSAIIEKGVEVPSDMTLAGLPEKIRAIATEDQPLTDSELEDFLADIFAEGDEGGLGDKDIESEV